MMTAAQPESPANEIEFLVKCLVASEIRYLAAVQGVSEAAANVKIGENSWSILHCAEHVATAERQMLAMWNKLAATGQRHSGERHGGSCKCTESRTEEYVPGAIAPEWALHRVERRGC